MSKKNRKRYPRKQKYKNLKYQIKEVKLVRLEKANVPMLTQTEKQYRNHAIKFANWCTYDWILWRLARPDNYAIWTADETQRRNLGDAASLYNFISTPEARDGTLQGNDISMLSLVVSRTTREYLDDYVFGTGINFQEFLCILISWLLKHPGEVKRILHTDMFWTRRDYRGDFAHIPSYEPIYRDAFKRNIDEVLDSVYRGVIPQRIRNDDGSMAMLIPCGAENSN